MPKPSKNKGAWPGGWWVCIGMCLCAPAQGVTVAEIIAHMKQQKQQESMGRPPNAVPAAPSKSVVEMPKLPTAPLLWSIIGIGEDLQAVLVYEGKAYVAQSTSPRSRMGPWWIESVSAQGVVLRLQANPKAAALVLNAPVRGMSIEPYALRLGVYPTTPVLPVGAPAQSPAARMSSPTNPLSALWFSKDSDPLLLGTLPSDPQSGPLPANLNPGLAPKSP